MMHSKSSAICAFFARSTVVVLVSMLVLSGCSFMVPGHQNIQIMPSNPRADVYVDNEFIGTGPQTVSLSKRETHSVMVKCGDNAGTSRVNRSLSGAGIADIIGGLIWLGPFIGLAGAGSRKLSPDRVSVAIPNSRSC